MYYRTNLFCGEIMKYVFIILFGLWLLGQVASCDKETSKDTQHNQEVQQAEKLTTENSKTGVQIEEPISQEELKRQQEKKKEEARLKLIEKQFRSWDGSHTLLKKIVKQSMHNPDSFEHVDTKCYDLGDRIRVKMTFRGTNGFGAVVTQQITAEFDLQGNFIQVVK